MRTHGFMIAAPQSGSGKTMVSLAVMAAFHRRGLTVAPFKCGPDFIDPGYHRAVTGQESINLDGWMCPEEFIGAAFSLHSMDSDIAVIEGVMGLFDGIGSSASEGSSAQIARLTGTPVVLVVNARGMAASASALVRGFVEFDPGVKIAGVIFNNVGSTTHGELLRAALASALPAIRVYGCVMRDESLVIPSRHLGLMTVEDNPLPADFIDRLVAMAEACLDLDGLAQLCSSSEPQPQPQKRSPLSIEKPVRIAVARDAAFCFVYPDNLRLLREAGSELIEFSPLVDSTLPPDIAGIYLPGGYPELYAGQLAANSNMLEAIREAVENDMPLYAECGGLIYLTEGMEGGAALAGIFPVRARMLDKRKALGYRQVEMREDTIMGEAGSVSRGHEFHYSEIGAMPERIARTFRISRRGEDLGVEGYCYRNCLASYVHLHFGSNPGLAAGFISSCRGYGSMLQDHTKQLPV